MDTLFPALPKDLAKLTDQEVNDLLAEHETAAGLIMADGKNDESKEFLAGLDADEIIVQFRSGADQIKALKAEVKDREDAAENFTNALAEIGAEIKGEVVAEPEPEPDDPDAENEVTPSAEAEVAEEDEEQAVEAKADDREPVLVADANNVTTTNSNSELTVEIAPPRLRRVPTPAPERVVVNDEPEKTLAFVASGFNPSTPPGKKFESDVEIAKAEKSLVASLGPVYHREDGREEFFKVATLDYSANFPPERTLDAKDVESNSDKIAAIGSPWFGQQGITEAFVASGGLCAPLTPIYSIPNLATTATPAWDSLPKFRAERGGINVPTPHTITDAAGSITTITEANDALGGTFATKACLAFDCPTYTETAVTIVAACREFGNLNAMAWPESIVHENELTAALYSRTVEELVLDRIKALSVNVTNGLETLGAMIYLVDAIVKSRFGIISRLRMDRNTRFVALLPAVLPGLLALDTVQTQFGRFASEDELVGYLRGLGIDPVFYLDTPTTGTSQIADTSQTAAAIDGLPDNIQWAIFPQGTFLGIDMAELNLGIVRDSTLNSTNDFQYFYEGFLNVARIGPAQAAYWVTSDICASGQFPPAGTVRTCD